MPFFGSAPSRAATPSFTPPPTKQSNPLFEEAPQTTSNPLFGAAPTTSGPSFGSAPSKASGPFFGANSGGRDPYSGSVSADGGSRSADDDESGYHFLTLTPGEAYTIAAIREEADLDPAMWVFSGHSTYEDFLASGHLTDNQFTNGMPSYLAYSDDVLPPPGGQGPYRDPQVTLTAPESGKVTIVVTEVASGSDDGGDGRFDYRLEVSPDPVDIRVEGEGSSTGTPFFGAAPKAGTNPVFGDNDWLTITFDEDNLEFINDNNLWLELAGEGALIGENDVLMPAVGGDAPYLALWSGGDLFGPESGFISFDREEGNPWQAGFDALNDQVDGTLMSGSALLMGFAATGDTQTVTFDWLLGVEDGTHSNSIAFYLTPTGDAGILGDTQSLTTGSSSGWQTSSVDLESVAESYLDEDLMAMFIGVANVGEDFVIEPEGGEIRIEEASPAMLLLDNITLVGVPEGGLSPLPMGVD